MVPITLGSYSQKMLKNTKKNAEKYPFLGAICGVYLQAICGVYLGAIHGVYLGAIHCVYLPVGWLENTFVIYCDLMSLFNEPFTHLVSHMC